MDFDDVFYLTDTGRRWDGWKVSVRDKVPQQEQWIEEGLVFGSTGEIIKKVESEKIKDKSEKLNPEHQTPNPLTPNKERRIKNKEQETTNNEQQTNYIFPSRVMFTFHPQRWTDKPAPWLKEFIMQNLKNVVKGVMVRWRKER